MAMTIDDYKRLYAEARARGDAAAMQAANDGANALRRQMGEKEEYAGEDIAKFRQEDYTPINSWAAQMVDEDAFYQQAAKQQQYIQENPSAVKSHSRREYRKRYGDIYDNAPYTTPADRVVPKGESGADAGLMSSGDYAVIQHLKGVWADSHEKYQKALEEGDTEEAQRWLEQRDNAHLETERIRAHYNYSGGEDGSMYMDFDFSPLDVERVRPDEDDGWDEEDGGGHGGDNEDDWDEEDKGDTDPRPGTGTILPQAQVEDFSRYLEELYAAKTQAALAELEAAYQKNVNSFDQTEAGIDGAWRAARNQTVADSELAARNFHEYAAASGLNNGTAGQAALARNVALQGNLNTINAGRASSVAELQLQRANAEVEYNNAIAQAEAKGDYELAAALYEEKVRVQELLLDWEIQQQKLELQWYQAKNQVRQDDEALALQQQKHEDSLEQAWREYQSDVSASQKQALAQYGQAYLKQGVMPSDEMLAAMGITKAQAQAYIDSVLTK